MLQKLTKVSELFAPNIFLKGVILLDDKAPVREGGFADIFKGSHNGEDIALKRLKIRSSDQAQARKVQ